MPCLEPAVDAGLFTLSCVPSHEPAADAGDYVTGVSAAKDIPCIHKSPLVRMYSRLQIILRMFVLCAAVCDAQACSVGSVVEGKGQLMAQRQLRHVERPQRRAPEVNLGAFQDGRTSWQFLTRDEYPFLKKTHGWRLDKWSRTRCSS